MDSRVHLQLSQLYMCNRKQKPIDSTNLQASTHVFFRAHMTYQSPLTRELDAGIRCSMRSACALSVATLLACAAQAAAQPAAAPAEVPAAAGNSTSARAAVQCTVPHCLVTIMTASAEPPAGVCDRRPLNITGYIVPGENCTTGQLASELDPAFSVPYRYSLDGNETRAVSALAQFKTPTFYYYDDSQTDPSTGECGLSVCHCDVCTIPGSTASKGFCQMYFNRLRNIVTSNETDGTGWSSVSFTQCTAGVSEALGVQLPERGSDAVPGGSAVIWSGGGWSAAAAAAGVLLLVV